MSFIGKLIQDHRKGAGLSLRELSYKIGGEPTHSSIDKYEKGLSKITLISAIKIANVLNIKLKTLADAVIEDIKNERQ